MHFTRICTIGKSVANKISNVNVKYTDFMDERSTSSMFLLPATETEIFNAISSLQPNKAIRDLDIPIKLLKSCKEIVKNKVCHIINIF